MHTAHDKPLPAGAVRAALVLGVAAAGLLLAGCASDPEVDPIFRVAPPGQQTTCPSGTYNCAPPGTRRQLPQTGY